MKKLFFLLLISFSVLSVKAQDYTTAAGFRGGFPYGITLKHKISDKAALEGILGGRWGGATLTGLYEIHKNAFDTEGLFWYYGAGAHIGFYRFGNVGWGPYYGSSYYDRTHVSLGIDGIVGIEYQIQEIPIVVGVDYKPGFNFVPLGALWGEGAISVRYVFN